MHAKHILTALLAFGGVGLVHAQDTKADNTTNSTESKYSEATAADLERLQAQTIMLEAQRARAEAADALSKIDGSGQATVQSAMSGPGTPVVTEVYGASRSLKATFLYPDRTTITAIAGDHLPGGCTVKSIAMDAVRIACHGQEQTVGFAGSVTPRANATTGGQQMQTGPTFITPVTPGAPFVPAMNQ